MTWSDWQSTPFILPLLLSGFLCGWATYVAWRRRAVPGAVPFALLMATLSGWALVSLVEKSLVNHGLRQALAVFSYIFIVTVPPAWLVFAARFARQERWLPRRLVLLLCIEPLAILALALTNRYHSLIYASTEMNTEGPFVIMAIRHGPFFYVHAGYTYVLFTAGAILLVMTIARQPGPSRGRTAVVLAAMLVPLLGNVAYVLHLQPRRLTDLTPVYFAVPGLAAAWMLFRIRLFDVLPIARDFILDCLEDAIFVLDTRGHILDANLAARALLQDPTEFHKQSLAVVLPEIGKYIPEGTGGAAVATEVRLVVSGNERSWDMRVLPLVDDGVLIGRLARLIDVTERRRLHQELSKQTERLLAADRRKDQFLAMLGHELRNPLAPILSALEILKRSSESRAALEATHRTIERQAQQLVRLVDDLLDVSRITRGRIQLRREPMDLAVAVATAVETSQPLFEAREQTLTVSLPPEPVWVQADTVRLAQIFANLLNNAAKYTDVGGSIRLIAERQSPYVVVRVKDTGIGMTAEMCVQAFALFTQDESALQRAQGGLGIGLTLVRALVEMHGGSVQAMSEGLGRGSEFVVRLPMIPAPLPAQPALKPKADAWPSRRILVVDDNVDAAETLATFLGMAGHKMCTAHDGLQALQAARVHRPDVVLLDIGMPGMDGYELARRLRQEQGFDKLLLVALTGYGQDEDRRRSQEASIDHHLVKPVDPESLQALLAL